jgi:hypothetical protein
MSSTLRFLTLLLLGLSLGFARTAHASHALGGSITYTSLGGNSYRIRVDFFRDCSGIAAPTSFSASCQTSCGGPATTLTLTQVGQPFIGTPYSSTIQPLAVCPLNMSAPTGAPTNYAAFRYEGTVTLTPNQWTISVEESARPSIANASAGTLRLEATLDNRTLTNNSVSFSNLPVFFVPHMQPNLLQIGAFDADGDSLSYSLVAPLSGCATYETYTAYPGSGCIPRVDPLCSRRVTSCAGLPSAYTATLPIAVANDTVYENGSTTRPPCPASGVVTSTVRPRFSFSPLQGSFSFTPSQYLNTPSANGDNKYVVDVKVTEWRRVNGTYVVVGTTRRDMVWVVYNGTTAVTPLIAPTFTVQNGTQTSGPQALNTLIPVQAGEPISINFSASSPGATTPLAFTLEQNTVPGAVIQAGATAGTGRLTFTPPLSLPNGTYRVSLTVTDDASPLRNIITVPVAFRVYRTALAARRASAAAIAAYPTPFTERVQFQLPKAGMQQLSVHDQLGRLVARLTSQPDGAVQWTPGPEVPAGLYLVRTDDGQLSVRLLRSAAQ